MPKFLKEDFSLEEHKLSNFKMKISESSNIEDNQLSCMIPTTYKALCLDYIIRLSVVNGVG